MLKHPPSEAVTSVAARTALDLFLNQHVSDLSLAIERHQSDLRQAVKDGDFKKTFQLLAAVRAFESSLIKALHYAADAKGIDLSELLNADDNDDEDNDDEVCDDCGEKHDKHPAELRIPPLSS